MAQRTCRSIFSFCFAEEAAWKVVLGGRVLSGCASRAVAGDTIGCHRVVGRVAVGALCIGLHAGSWSVRSSLF